MRAAVLGLPLWSVLEKTRLMSKLATKEPRIQQDPHQLAFLVSSLWPVLAG